MICAFSFSELDRAKNMLRGNVLTQLESRLVLFEDLGRQVLTYGAREQVQITCEKIHAVSAADIMDVMNRAVTSSPPTCAVVGGGVKESELPTHDQLCKYFAA